MTAPPDRALLLAATAFAGATAVGSAVAIRDQLPGQPLGVTVPLSVPAGLLAGWGAGVAAPWPMPAVAVITAARAQRTGPSVAAGRVCTAIGLSCVVGTVMEPVARRRAAWSSAAGFAMACNLAASAALIAAGWRHAAAARGRR